MPMYNNYAVCPKWWISFTASPMEKREQIFSILGSYVSHIVKKYDKAVVAFDGYEHGPAPKDVTRNRRIDVSKGIEVEFQEDVALVIKKDVFLAK